MLQKFMDTIRAYKMLGQGDKVLAGLSGGADSVCLLLNLLEIAQEFDLDISALHLNHQLRGADSDNDEEFCIQLCKRLGVQLTVQKLEVMDYVKKTGKSIEESARDLRYIAFEEHSHGGKIATAHSLSDNVETVLFNLTRGTGLKGICGIPPVRDKIIRPLITTSREEIEEYLNEKGQDFVTDKTNLSTDYTRNKIRLEVIPKLKSINPNLLGTMGNTIQSLTFDNNYLEIESKKVYNSCKDSKASINANKLKAEHKAVRRRCIAFFLKENGFENSFDKIISIDGILENGGKINLVKNVYITVKMGILSIVRDLPPAVNVEAEIQFGINTFLDKFVNLEIISYQDFIDNQIVNKKFAIYYIDYDKIQGKVVLRNRRNGDKIRLLNRNFESSVKKIFNAKIKLSERSRQIFLADESGVVFIENIGISDRVKVDEMTKNILKIEIDGSVSD